MRMNKSLNESHHTCIYTHVGLAHQRLLQTLGVCVLWRCSMCVDKSHHTHDRVELHSHQYITSHMYKQCTNSTATCVWRGCQRVLSSRSMRMNESHHARDDAVSHTHMHESCNTCKSNAPTLSAKTWHPCPLVAQYSYRESASNRATPLFLAYIWISCVAQWMSRVTHRNASCCKYEKGIF